MVGSNVLRISRNSLGVDETLPQPHRFTPFCSERMEPVIHPGWPPQRPSPWLAESRFCTLDLVAHFPFPPLLLTGITCVFRSPVKSCFLHDAFSEHLSHKWSPVVSDLGTYIVSTGHLVPLTVCFILLISLFCDIAAVEAMPLS